MNFLEALRATVGKKLWARSVNWRGKKKAITWSAYNECWVRVPNPGPYPSQEIIPESDDLFSEWEAVEPKVVNMGG